MEPRLSGSKRGSADESGADGRETINLGMGTVTIESKSKKTRQDLDQRKRVCARVLAEQSSVLEVTVAEAAGDLGITDPDKRAKLRASFEAAASRTIAHAVEETAGSSDASPSKPRTRDRSNSRSPLRGSGSHQQSG